MKKKNRIDCNLQFKTYLNPFEICLDGNGFDACKFVWFIYIFLVEGSFEKKTLGILAYIYIYTVYIYIFIFFNFTAF